MAKKRYATIYKRMSMNEIELRLVADFNEEAAAFVKNWFIDNPKKQVLHITNAKMKIRRYGNEYTIEEA